IITTTVSGLRRRISRKNSRPFIPGIMRSTSATAYELRPSASAAWVGWVKGSICRSSRRNARLRERHKLTSSSSNSSASLISRHRAGSLGLDEVALQWQADTEHTTAPHLRRDGDLPTVRGDDAVTDCEPKTVSGTALLRGVEGVKDVVEIGRINATTVIAKLDHRLSPATFDRLARVDPDRARPLHSIGGVEQEVEEYLLQLPRIHPEGRQLRIQRPVRGQTARAVVTPGNRNGLPHEC